MESGSSFTGWPSRLRLGPTLSKVDSVDDPGDRVEAENREHNPRPVITPREEPGEHCVNAPANDHGARS